MFFSGGFSTCTLLWFYLPAVFGGLSSTMGTLCSYFSNAVRTTREFYFTLVCVLFLGWGQEQFSNPVQIKSNESQLAASSEKISVHYLIGHQLVHKSYGCDWETQQKTEIMSVYDFMGKCLGRREQEPETRT